MNESQKARVEKLKKAAAEQKPIRAPETERTEQDSRRTNPEVEKELGVPEPTTLVGDNNDPKRPFI